MLCLPFKNWEALYLPRTMGRKSFIGVIVQDYSSEFDAAEISLNATDVALNANQDQEDSLSFQPSKPNPSALDICN